MRQGTLRGGPFGYTDEGDGPVIVAVHGLPGSQRDFRWLAPALTEHFRFVRLDLPGFGGTPWTTRPGYSPVDRAAFVLEALDALDLRDPMLMGHSMGGVVACAAAQIAPPNRLRSLCLVSSPGLIPHRGLRRIPSTTISKWLASPRRTKLSLPLIRRVFTAAGFRGPYPDDALVHTLHGVAAVDIGAHAERVRTLVVPTAQFWCHDDPLIEPEISEAMGRALPGGPREGFSDGGHNPQKFHAVEIGEALLEWMQDAWVTREARIDDLD